MSNKELIKQITTLELKQELENRTIKNLEPLVEKVNEILEEIRTITVRKISCDDCTYDLSHLIISNGRVYYVED